MQPRKLPHPTRTREPRFSTFQPRSSERRERERIEAEKHWLKVNPSAHDIFTMRKLPDGKVRVAGICTRKMNDGASESDVFSLEPGAERGTWKQVAGTGALAGKSYSGWWQSVISDGKAEMGIWGGNCN